MFLFSHGRLHYIHIEMITTTIFDANDVKDNVMYDDVHTWDYFSEKLTVSLV